jgi:hypothetical protein
MKQVVKLAFERATKRTFRFKEQAPEGEEVIGTLYVQQRVFDGKEPKSIQVTIEVTE